MTKSEWSPGKERQRRAAARWLVLMLLVVGVGTLAVCGGGDDAGQGGARRLLETRLAEIQQKEIQQAEIQQKEIEEIQPAAVTAAGDDMAGVAAESPVNPPIGTKQPGQSAAATSDASAQEVWDDAPEPWVGDAALTVEAELVNMLSPLSGVPNRSFGFGYDATFDDYRLHQGVDWQAEPGTAVQAPLAGTVKLLDDPYYGSGIELTHNGGLVSRYYGITPAAGLSDGCSVGQGERLGEVGQSPLFEDGQPPHLHWEIWLGEEAVNPADYQSAFIAEQ